MLSGISRESGASLSLVPGVNHARANSKLLLLLLMLHLLIRIDMPHAAGLERWDG